MKNKPENKPLDVFDWSIRQMRSMGYLTMRQHILVLRLLSKSAGRKKRFSNSEIGKICK